MGVDDGRNGSVGAEVTTYSVAEAARRLGVTESAVRKRLDRGVLKAARTQGGRVRLDLDSVEKERQQRLERVDGTVSEMEDLRTEVGDLRATVNQLRSDKARFQAAFDALLAAEAALHDTIRQLVAEQTMIDS